LSEAQATADTHPLKTRKRLKKRSAASALTVDEQKLLEDYGVPTAKVIAQAKYFVINPKYCGDMELLEKVSAAISEMVPEDFIVVQEEESKTVIAENAVEVAFEKHAPREGDSGGNVGNFGNLSRCTLRNLRLRKDRGHCLALVSTQSPRPTRAG